MSSDNSLLRISDLALPFSGDLKGLVLPRITNKTVRSFLIAKGLPTLGPLDSFDPDLVRSWQTLPHTRVFNCRVTAWPRQKSIAASATTLASTLVHSPR